MKYKTLSNNCADETINFSSIRPTIGQLAYVGNLPPLPRLGIIGTRRPTPYGTEVAKSLSYAAAESGISVISGLAIGIDSIVHQAALDADGHTIAVVPGSLESVYPARHRPLARRITESGGAIVSESHAQTSIQKYDFIKRNRIIAGLSDVLLVIEASHKSGTMHTVNFMLEAGKPVAAVPGPINSHSSSGTNWLIKNGAHVIDTVDELLSFFPQNKTVKQDTAILDLNEDASQVHQYLQNQSSTIGSICAGTQLSIQNVMSALTDLEIAGIVAKDQDGMYALRLAN